MVKNKIRWIVLTIVMITMMTFMVVRLAQINTNHKANLAKSEECMVNGGTVVMKNEGFLSLTTVTCDS